jgi:NAD(P)-dependent dehydrogenase (short-subunit alcohol dehydrogenase family)
MPKRALITGASRGLGLALARSLATDGWELIIDARGERGLRNAAADLGRTAAVHAVPGDVADEAHRLDLAAAVDALGGGLELVVHNASLLGPSPQPLVSEYPLRELERVYAANVFGPLRLTQLLLPCMGPGARIVSITSDAAVEAYEGWGGYGSSKAALEQWTRVPPNGPTCACTSSIPATCARRCTRTRSRARTSPTVRSPRQASPVC